MLLVDDNADGGARMAEWENASLKADPEYGDRLEPVQYESWQTGRWYGDKGQRMAAARLSDGRVVFWDLDRCIDGVLEKPYQSNQFLRQQVMWEYDRNGYSSAYRLRHNEDGSKSALFSELQRLALEVPPPKEPR